MLKKEKCEEKKNSRKICTKKRKKRNVFGLNCLDLQRMSHEKEDGKQQICEIGKIGLQKQDYSE